MKRSLTSLLIVAAVTVAAQVTTPVQANESGFASIHSWRKVGRKTCLVGHQHAGSASGPSEKAAQAETIRSWASFTDLEYGSSWANYGHAIEKIMKCGPTGGGAYQCDLLATPCRGW